MNKNIIAIIDYGVGNLHSVANAFRHAAICENIDPDLVVITNEPDVIAMASRVILPGDGSFSYCYDSLCAINGMIEAINYSVRNNIFLGICVGMQLMANYGLEGGKSAGFGWIPGIVTCLDKAVVRVPHMGWNDVFVLRPSFFESGKNFYFLHSYIFCLENSADLLAYSMYGDIKVAAVIAKDNIMGVQFHPEKSQIAGIKFIRGFLRWRG